MARIELPEEEIVRLLRASAIASLRPESSEYERERAVATARTALDALCGLEERAGLDAAYSVLRALVPRDLRALALLMVVELGGVGWRPPPFPEG
ncbi:MAG TPA: hypothetical protein VFT42_06770 [Solirubrobacteraceae bacterium]|nr:hypothetical protein [Solirubrobacteraceae bacterium]